MARLLDSRDIAKVNPRAFFCILLLHDCTTILEPGTGYRRLKRENHLAHCNMPWTTCTALKVLVNSFVSDWPSEDITRSVRALRRSGFITLKLKVGTEVISINIYSHFFCFILRARGKIRQVRYYLLNPTSSFHLLKYLLQKYWCYLFHARDWQIIREEFSCRFCLKCM